MLGFFSVPVLMFLLTDYRAIKTEHGAKFLSRGVMAGVMAAVPAPWPVGRQSSNAAKASDIQESEAVPPPGLEGGTLCLFLLKPSIKGGTLKRILRSP